MEKKAAFVALAGRPSAGKSTLLNIICGEKVAIVSAVPQTTRNNIRGIYNDERGQIIFVDTPGRHKSDKKFNKKLQELSDRAASESDLILYVLDASRPPAEEELAIAEFLAPHAARTVAVINKVDREDADVAAARAFIAEHLPGLGDRCFEVSAKNNEGIRPVIDSLFGLSPAGEPFYDDEFYTDQEVDFRIAEIIREQAINRLREEIPHSLYVDIADMQFSGTSGGGDVFGDLSGEESSDKKLPENAVPRLWVRAFIVVERESQKGVVVGSGGLKIKAIRLASLAELKKVFDWKITLDLRVKTAKNWRQNDNSLRRITEKN